MSTVGRKQYGHYKDEQAVIEIIKLKRRKRKGGSTLGPWQIAIELNAEKYPGPGGGIWHGISVKRIIARIDKQGTKPKKVKKQHLNSNDYLTKEELAMCRRDLRGTEWIAFEIMVGSGLRASEVCALQVRDIGVFHGKGQIDVRRGKGCRQRKVDIGPKLKDDLQMVVRHTVVDLEDKKRYLFHNHRGKALNYSNLYYLISKIRDRSGVKRLHPHALRHTFAVFLYNYKMDLEYVRQQLGHASIATTQIYVNTLNASKLEQMKGFEKSLES